MLKYGEISKDDVVTFDVCTLASKMVSLINRSTDWPFNCHKTTRFPKIFYTHDLMDKLTLNELAIHFHLLIILSVTCFETSIQT